MNNYPPQDAVDFSLTTWWSAGAGAVQWIEIDLGAPATIERFKLVDLFGGPGLHVNKLWGKGLELVTRMFSSPLWR